MCPGGGPVLGGGPGGVGQPGAAAPANEAAGGVSEDVSRAVFCGEYKTLTNWGAVGRFLRQSVGCEVSLCRSITSLRCSDTSKTSSNEMKRSSSLLTRLLKSPGDIVIKALLFFFFFRLAYSEPRSVPAVITVKLVWK